MPVRILSWNVGGIQNFLDHCRKHFGRPDLDMERAFDLLEADIVCFQDVQVDRLNQSNFEVQNWASFYSFPTSKTGCAGVAMYTRSSKCAPVLYENGITGSLQFQIPALKQEWRYIDAPEMFQIGGYPVRVELGPTISPGIIDSEGRCQLLEFPLFVLINVYCPEFRKNGSPDYHNGFLLTLNARIRRLVSLGKRIVLVGNLNTMRDQLDWHDIWDVEGHKAAEEGTIFDIAYMPLPAPRLLNRLFYNSRLRSDIIGEPFDDTRTLAAIPPVLYDTCRELHPSRKFMFTSYRSNTESESVGSRTDYIACSPGIMPLVQKADIWPSLHGLGHCPVFIDLRDCFVYDTSRTVLQFTLNKPYDHAELGPLENTVVVPSQFPGSQDGEHNVDNDENMTEDNAAGNPTEDDADESPSEDDDDENMTDDDDDENMTDDDADENPAEEDSDDDMTEEVRIMLEARQLDTVQTLSGLAQHLFKVYKGMMFKSVMSGDKDAQNQWRTVLSIEESITSVVAQAAAWSPSVRFLSEYRKILATLRDNIKLARDGIKAHETKNGSRYAI